jgi:hypothetical protein
MEGEIHENAGRCRCDQTNTGTGWYVIRRYRYKMISQGAHT